MIPLPPILIGLIALVVYRSWRARRRWGLPLPPGPKGLPIIGNLLDIRSSYQWLSFTSWKDVYGDIIYLESFGNSIVVLNSTKTATELFERRSSNYSDRPNMVMMGLAGWNWVIGFTPYSNHWRRLRKMFHQYFQQKAISKHHEYITQTSQTFVRSLLETPEGFGTHVQNYSGTIILRLSYGYEAQAEQDEYIMLVNRAAESLVEVNPGNYLVDSIPILQYLPSWLPGMSFKSKSREWAALTQAARVKPFDIVKKAMDEGTAHTSLALDNLQNLKDDMPIEEQENIIRDCAAVAYIAGSETTIALIFLAMMAIVRYPDVQSRAQEEIRRVVGTSRLPSFEDRESLPYVDALVLEALRWGPITPLAIHHRSIDDDIYEGYFIPGGSTVIGNAWGILHDKELYPDPYEFKPERFLAPNKAPNPVDIGAFGFGRRICPGRYLAMDTSWIAIAQMLAGFRLSKAVDATGAEIDVPFEFFDGFIPHPKPFKICFTPHSPEIARLIKETHNSQNL